MATKKKPTKKTAKKPVKKPGKKHQVAPDVQPVTINSICSAEPQTVHLGGPHNKSKIQFHCGAGNFFVVTLDGGVFVGQPVPFPVIVDGPAWVPDPPLEVELGINDEMPDYIFDITGGNCALARKKKKKVGADPPDIIINS